MSSNIKMQRNGRIMRAIKQRGHYKDETKSYIMEFESKKCNYKSKVRAKIENKKYKKEYRQ